MAMTNVCGALFTLPSHTSFRVHLRLGHWVRRNVDRAPRHPPLPPISMSHLIVHGGRPLRGTVTPSANKNAVLPVLCATLLTDEPVQLHRVPDITDVRKLLAFFRELGSSVEMDFASGTLKLQHGSRLDAGAVRVAAGAGS